MKCGAVAELVGLANVTVNAELKPVRTDTAVQARGVLPAALSSHCCYGPCSKPDRRGLAICSSVPEHLINYYHGAEIQG